MADVVLRRLTLEDQEALVALSRRNREFLSGLMPAGDEKSDEDHGQWVLDLLAELEAGTKWFGVIEYDATLVGALSFRLDHGLSRSANIGYWVSEEVNGRGVATEAVKQALDLIFNEFGMHRVDAFVRPDNQGSRRVLEKNGFWEVGLSRGHLHIGGRWWDMTYFQTLAPWDDGERLEPSDTSVQDTIDG